MFSSILALTVLATTAYAQSTTEANVETTTAELLLGTLTAGFSGTVVTAAPCETIYALTCSGQEQCPDDPVTVHATLPHLLHLRAY